MPAYRPLLSLVELTLRCNLRCIHCGSTSGKPRDGELRDDELFRLIDELAALGAEELVFLGGEPLLHPRWEQLCAHTSQAGVAPLLITNGFLLDDSTAKRCARAGVIRVGVSVDGPTPDVHDAIRGVRGSHERAMRAVDALQDQGVACTVITTVSQKNLHTLWKLRDMLLGRGIGWQLQVASPNGARFDRKLVLSRGEFYALAAFIARCRSEYSLEELPVAGAHDIGYHATRLRNYAYRPDWPGCQGGLSTVGVRSDGTIMPCLALPDRFVEGNIRDAGGLTAVWRSPEHFVRNRRFRVEWLEGGCGGCEHGATCRAGCPDMAWNATGSDLDNPYCLHRIETEGIAFEPATWTINGTESGAQG